MHKQTHLELLNSPLQAFCRGTALFRLQLILCCLQPPEEGAREATELHQLLLTSLNSSRPERVIEEMVEKQEK